MPCLSLIVEGRFDPFFHHVLFFMSVFYSSTVGSFGPKLVSLFSPLFSDRLFVLFLLFLLTLFFTDNQAEPSLKTLPFFA